MKADSAALAVLAQTFNPATAEHGNAHSASIADNGNDFCAALAEQGKDLRAGMRQLEMKIDKPAAGVNWIRGVLEGFVHNPRKEPEARTPVSEWREDGDSASP